MTELENQARLVASRLREHGHVAYFAGGCVRDRLLDRQADDIDLATSARPEEVQKIFPRTLAVGAHFGVIIVLQAGFEFQVATFRNDGAYVDGRRPETVVFSSPEEDARRRDFTINGLFFDPATDQLIDFVGGQEDLRAGILRAIGDPRRRFAEDYLRVLRAVRFSATLGFPVDAETWEAVKEAASQIHRISPERCREELSRIFADPSRVAGLDLLLSSGLLRELLPEVDALRGCEQPPEFHPEGDVYVHTRIMLEMLAPDASLPLVLAVLFHDIGKPPTFERDATGRIRFNGHERVSAEMTRRIMGRLRFSSAETEDVVEMVRQHMAFKDVQQMRVAKLKRFMSRPTFGEELELHRVDCSSSHGMLDNLTFLRRKHEEFASEPLIPPPLLTGRDLIALGMKPGPRFKEILTEAQTLQLEGGLSSPEDARAWAAALYHRESV